MFDLRIEPQVTGCENDQVQIANTIPALNVYYLNAPALSLKAQVTQSATQCPLQCFLTQGAQATG